MIGYSEIIIPQPLKSQLLTCVKKKSVPNTILFTGTNGGSAIGVALALAKHMICENPNDFDSCNLCRSCQQFNHFNYPDIHFTFPFSKSKSKLAEPSCAEFQSLFATALQKNIYLTQERWLSTFEADNQQLSITVGEAKEISKVLSIKGFSNKPRFVFIWQPELLNATTANKLLKTIEEPGENVYIFLVSHKPKSVLATILSRCITIKIPSNTIAETKSFFQGIPIKPPLFPYLVINSKGSFGKAIDLLENSDEANLSSGLLVQWLRILYSKDIKSALIWSEAMAGKNREEIRLFLLFSITIIRQAHLINQNSLAEPSFEHLAFDVKKFAPFILPEETQRILTSLQKCYNDVLRNGNAKTILLDTSLDLFKYIGKT